MNFFDVIKILKKLVEVIEVVEETGLIGEEKKKMAVEVVKKEEGQNISTEKVGEIIDNVIGVINDLKGDEDE